MHEHGVQLRDKKEMVQYPFYTKTHLRINIYNQGNPCLRLLQDADVGSKLAHVRRVLH